MIRRMVKAARRARAAIAAGEAQWQVLIGSQNGLSPVGSTSIAGPTVSQQSMMQLSAVFACTSRTSQMIATMPGALYQRGANNSRDRVEDTLMDVLAISPNADQTAAEFWEGMVAQMLMKGNAVAEEQRLGDRLVGLTPLPQCEVHRNREGDLIYRFLDRGKVETMPANKVFHLRGFGAGDGIGLSAVRYGVTSFGAALAADQTASGIFSNGMMPSGIVEYDASLTQDQRDRLGEHIESWTGSKRAGKVIVLENGLKYSPVTMNPEDAQLLETRRFSVEDICRWFGVPPIIIGHSADGQTMWGTGVEAIMLSWLTTGINPMLRKIEQRILKDLIPVAQRKRWYFEFNREAILQMDSQAKGEFMSKMGASGTMTANERRARLNLPRSDDPNADRLLAQTALAPLSDLGRNTQ